MPCGGSNKTTTPQDATGDLNLLPMRLQQSYEPFRAERGQAGPTLRQQVEAADLSVVRTATLGRCRSSDKLTNQCSSRLQPCPHSRVVLTCASRRPYLKDPRVSPHL